jgi:hypothetical protein
MLLEIGEIVDPLRGNPVQPEDSQFFVELVFVALVGGNFDDGSDPEWRFGTGGNVVPGVEAAGRRAGTEMTFSGEVPLPIQRPDCSLVRVACDRVLSRLSCRR